ncbi:MAG TPA: PAS domain-containing protein [Rhizomicrobium sp.]|nr:PAS domain-containing protein [Rhizomicrobium sp.]
MTDYWLSLWKGDALPSRADFKPKNILKELQAVALFDVIPDVSVRCRLLGSGLARGLGADITGQDWLALTRPEDRPIRLLRWSVVARGSIGRGLRAGMRESGAMQYSEELMLPFGDVAEDGSRQVLFHLSWRQTTYDPTRGGIMAVNSVLQDFRLIELQK